MIQSRPKYTIEEFSIVFPFEENLPGVPEVFVELVSGEDPNKDSLIKAIRAYKNLAVVFIAGGVAGCIYKVSCLSVGAEISTIISVLHTFAEAPAGGFFPFTFRRNSFIYPLSYEDAVSVQASVVSGMLKALVQESSASDDFVDLTPSMISGKLFPSPTGYIYDSVNLTAAVQSGILYAAPLGSCADDVSILLAVQSAKLAPAPTGNVQDFVDISFGVIGGTLSA